MTTPDIAGPTAISLPVLQEKMLARMKLNALRNRITERFDRYCHPDKPSDGTLGFQRMFREYNRV